MTDETTVAMTNIYVAVTDNIIPLNSYFDNITTLEAL